MGGDMAGIREAMSYSYSLSLGRPIVHGDLVVTPMSRVLAIRLLYWGFVWNRPVGVRIQDGESTRELAIVDMTRVAQIVLFSLGLAASILAMLMGRARSG
jgi:hypothetical protein